MKRIMFVVFTLAVLFCASMALAEETYTCGDFEYALMPDGSAELIRYTGEEGNVIIPIALDGHPIMAVRKNPFVKYMPAPDNSILGPMDCSVMVDQQHPYLATIDGVLFGKTDRKLIFYPRNAEASSYTIPDGITAIGDAAFYRVPALQSVIIPESVTSIGSYAFYYCENLVTADIPASVSYIGKWAFRVCRSLLSVNIPDGITTIYDATFGLCDNLANVTIPESVTSIGDYAFDACHSLSALYIPPTVTSIGTTPFRSCPNLTIYVVSGSPAAACCAQYSYLHWQTIDASYWTTDYSDAPTDWLNP